MPFDIRPTPRETKYDQHLERYNTREYETVVRQKKHTLVNSQCQTNTRQRHCFKSTTPTEKDLHVSLVHTPRRDPPNKPLTRRVSHSPNENERVVGSKIATHCQSSSAPLQNALHQMSNASFRVCVRLEANMTRDLKTNETK